MSSYAITAEVRAKGEKLSSLRQGRRVPAVIYGRQQEPISISLDASDILRLHRNAGKSNIIDVTVGKKKLEVLIHQVQFDPVLGSINHVDFYAIIRGEALHAEISLNFVGEAPAKKEGAIVDEILSAIKVKCRPRDLVDHFDVDLSILKEEGDAIRISDLGIDASKYEIEGHNDDDVVASAYLPRAVVASSDEDEEETTEETTEPAEEK
ncbi:50S ribosomal protein L25 [Candidatus Gracilibacteria bacterium]|nr:50S ribosomal protein L25 [Candidatus Gracilibacteria bacterium]